MDRNSVIGLLLIAVIIVVFSIYNQPSEAEIKEQNRIRDSIAQLELSKDSLLKENNKSIDSTTVRTEIITSALTDSLSPEKRDSIQKAAALESLKQQYGVFAHAANDEKKYYTLENEKIKIVFTNKGGRITSVYLKNYQSYRDYIIDKNNIKPLQLFDEDSSVQSISFFLNDREYNTQDFYFSTNAKRELNSLQGDSTIVFTLESAPGQNIQFVYKLKPNSYLLDFYIVTNGFANEKLSENLTLNWQMKMLSSEKLLSQERQVSSVFYRYMGEGRSYLSEMSSDSKKLEAPVNWIAFKQSYFSAVLISEKGIAKEGSEIAINTITSDKYIKEYIAGLNVSQPASNTTNYPLQFYFGPNDYHILKHFDNEMDNIINLGWGIFGWVNKWLVLPVFNFFERLGLTYGIIILLLTLVVKILILPLTYRNYKSSAKMRVLKPEVDEIGKKYKDDPMGKQREVMALYRKSGVNPLAGCIPLLVQMPVLLAVFRFFPAAIELRQQNFLWAEDLSAYDSILDFGFNIPFYGDHVSLFTLLMAASTILITRMNSGQMDTSMPGMKFMMYFFPVMMIFFFNNFSSGLTYYYLVSNLMSLVIMWAIKKYFIDEKKILAVIQENRKNPKAQKKSAFMERLEQAAKQRQQQLEQKKKRKK
jgi:YidC/Oxa1 family membrane protein insertase